MIRPKLEAPQLTIAEEQEEFAAITGAIVRHPDYPSIRARLPSGELVDVNSVVVAFRPSDDERQRIAAGEDLYVSLLTNGNPMQGVIVRVGPEEFASWYGVEVEK